MNISNRISVAKEKMKGKHNLRTGRLNTIILDGKAYPYMIIAYKYMNLIHNDSFTLLSQNKEYSATLLFSEAELHGDNCILWFPMPPKGLLYSLKLSFAPRMLNFDGITANRGNTLSGMEYLIFKDEVLTHIENEQNIPNSIIKLRNT